MGPYDPQPMHRISGIVVLGPMPRELDQVPPRLAGLTAARAINPHDLWHERSNYWPSQREPPYTIPDGWLWSWHEEDDDAVWEIVGVHF